MDWTERKGKEEEADRSPEWHIIKADESDTHEYFKERLPDLIENGFVLVPNWESPWTPPGEDSLWLLERGFNFVPILTKDVVLV